jgi:hypothetical protein
MQGVWDETGVNTYSVEEVDIGELKTFRVRARVNHPGAFAVLVDQETEFQVSGERRSLRTMHLPLIKTSRRVLRPLKPPCNGHSNLRRP